MFEEKIKMVTIKYTLKIPNVLRRNKECTGTLKVTEYEVILFSCTYEQ